MTNVTGSLDRFAAYRFSLRVVESDFWRTVLLRFVSGRGYVLPRDVRPGNARALGRALRYANTFRRNGIPTLKLSESMVAQGLFCVRTGD